MILGAVLMMWRDGPYMLDVDAQPSFFFLRRITVELCRYSSHSGVWSAPLW